MALLTPLHASPEEVRAALLPLRNDFSIAIHSCQNAFAVGAIVRVAHSFLAREIIIIGDEPHYAKASMGMEKYESILRVPNDEAFFLLTRGRPVWALEKDRAQRSLYAVDAFPPNVVLVMGSERNGLSSAFLDRADAIVGIPIYGVNHSLPVTVAAGIVMHEWARRKYAPSSSH